MKNFGYMFIGVVFGLALTKGEAISWYRIQEMFHFQSFHMFGIFMTAAPVGAISIILIKKFHMRSAAGEVIVTPVGIYRHGLIFGGLIFGFGWALTGACPGPLYAQLGAGYGIVIVPFVSALIGTWVYARLKPLLPD